MLPVLAALSLRLRLADSTARPASERRSGPRHVHEDDLGAACRADAWTDATDLVGGLAPIRAAGAVAEPYLRNLAAFVLLSTIARHARRLRVQGAGGGSVRQRRRPAALLRHLLRGDQPARLLVQTTSSALALEKLGLASRPARLRSRSASAASARSPCQASRACRRPRRRIGVPRLAVPHGLRAVLHTRCRPTEKRAAKSIIDVGFDRLGDAHRRRLDQPADPAAAGAAGQRHPGRRGRVLAGRRCSSRARLNRGYIQTLERSLVNRAVELDLSTSRTSRRARRCSRTLQTSQLVPRTPRDRPPTNRAARTAWRWRTRRSQRSSRCVRATATGSCACCATRTNSRRRWCHTSSRCWPGIRWRKTRCGRCARSRRSASATLTDALIDPNQPFAVRRRLARVFSICVSQRAVDALHARARRPALRSALPVRPLARRRSWRRTRCVRIDRERIFDVVRREVTVSRPVWESHRLLDGVVEEDEQGPSSTNS